MVRHADNGLVADLQVGGADGNAGVGQALHFAAEVLQIDDHAVAHDIDDLGPQDAGRQQVQDEFAQMVHDGMPCVVAALITDYNVIILGEQVDHAALSFIAPVDPGDSCQHCDFLLFFTEYFLRPSGEERAFLIPCPPKPARCSVLRVSPARTKALKAIIAYSGRKITILQHFRKIPSRFDIFYKIIPSGGKGK